MLFQCIAFNFQTPVRPSPKNSRGTSLLLPLGTEYPSCASALYEAESAKNDK